MVLFYLFSKTYWYYESFKKDGLFHSKEDLFHWLTDSLTGWWTQILTDWLTALLPDHWIKRQTNQWTNQTFERFKDQCDNQHTIWWINKLKWKLTIRPTVQLTNQLSNWPTIEQSTHQLTDRPNIRLTNHLTNWTSNKVIDQTTE